MKNYAVKVLKGGLKGKVFPLKNRLVFGRSFGDIVLKNLSVSDPHAEVRRHSDDRVMLRDLDSKNGVFINGERKTAALLERGSVFTIGEADFQLIAFKSPEKAWMDFLLSKAGSVRDRPLDLQAFPCPVEALVAEGPQKSAKFILEYGPRSFGSGSVDVPLLDEQIPDKAFRLIPSGSDIVLETERPDLLLCNGKELQESSFVLSGDDMISCGETKLRIRFKPSKRS